MGYHSIKHLILIAVIGVMAMVAQSQKPRQTEAVFCGSFVINGDERTAYFDYFKEQGCETIRFRQLVNKDTEEQTRWLVWGVKEIIGN